ncbi:MAG TPA: ubiquinol-cytochrome c reductase iron-sulfur subunit [Thermoanaerobaculia bacterium]|nr:ubiquinol-cytochrome c reductase iron-sulfur subunit [Thermoanaerobaculia bacterium]
MDSLARESRFDRRKLLNWFLGTSFGALLVSIVYPVVRFVTPPRIAEASMNEVEAGLAEDPGLIEKGFKIVRFGADPVILVRTADAKFYAYSATCTHLDCIVGFQKEHSRIWCHCHGGGYDLAGRNVIGPPPRPLTAYKVNLVEKAPGSSTIVISKA